MDMLKRLVARLTNKKRSKSSQKGQNASELGIRAGVSDLIIIEPNKEYNGLAIEFKIGKAKPTMAQKLFLHEVGNKGFLPKVIRTFGEFKSLIDFYVKRSSD